jgi:hypothetical protein
MGVVASATVPYKVVKKGMGANDWMLEAEKAVPEVKATLMPGIYDCLEGIW